MGVELRQAERDGPVAGKAHGEEDPAAVGRRRCGVDGARRRDPVLGPLQARFEGLHGFKLAGEVRHAWPARDALLASLDAERVTGLQGEAAPAGRRRGGGRRRRARRRCAASAGSTANTSVRVRTPRHQGRTPHQAVLGTDGLSRRASTVAAVRSRGGGRR
ncbi:MAG: hypothetical protein AVDCRST_MAG53-3518 [uncultured Solirubrobacteraceae bacterium]|uniref:Uncharacterized protein n=1 Tax=uncultured Solirubrobacteraceae bacterium TaxID=1162706 RepID=A0A6J4TDU8_9ACTN|nr:MAG: hypothetical protein AVDCRST_MAG53-3518 [uncultured Solirubrobacteraceae bacterium]